MKFTTGFAQHIGTRHQQQDTYGMLDHASRAFRQHAGLLVAVADGMGGMAHGEKASRTAIDALLAAYRTKTSAEPIPNALHRSLEEANRAVYKTAAGLGAPLEMGTTLIAGVLKDDRFHWVSTGDSGIFLIRDRQITQLNRMHTYAEELDELAEKGIIPKEVAEQHPEREALTAFAGMEHLKLVDANSIPVHHGDLILLASDGLFKSVPSQQIVAMAEGEPKLVAERMVRETIAAQVPFQDNVTVVAVRVEDVPEPTSGVKRVLVTVGIAGALAALTWLRSKLR